MQPAVGTQSPAVEPSGLSSHRAPRPDRTVRPQARSYRQILGPPAAVADGGTADAAGVGRAAARLKADGNADTAMLLLTAKAAREIVEAVDANTAALKRLEDEVGDVKGVLKDLKGEVGDVNEALERIEGKADGKTDA